MKNKHRTLSSLLALSVLMGATPTMVFADDFIEESGGVTTQEPGVTEVSDVTGLTTALQSNDANTTVKLSNDITLTETLDITLNKNITLDLAGHSITLSSEDKTAFMKVKSNSDSVFELTLKNSDSKNGKIEIDTKATAISVAEGTKMVTENINVNFIKREGGANCAFIIEGELLVKAGTNIKSAEGGIWVNKLGKLTIEDGLIDAYYYAVTGNGSDNATITGGTTIEIKGGVLSAEDATAIYHPQKGTLTLNGGEITGTSGVQMCNGTLNIPEKSSVKVTATGTDNREGKEGSDGTLDDGAAISLISRPGYNGTPTADIKGGSFASTNEGAKETILAYSWKDTPNPGEDRLSSWDGAKDNTDVTGGEFNKGFDKNLVKDTASFVKVDGTYYAAKDAATLNKIADTAKKSIVLLTKGTDVKDVEAPSGVTVKNETGKPVNVNGTQVGNGDTVNIPTSSGGGSVQKLSKVYRAYNPNNGEHLYTLDEKEYKHVTSIGWQAEDVAFMAETEKNGKPLYRVYNPNSGLHHYTLDENEKKTLVSLGWHDEKVAWYTSSKPQSAPVYRVYNPNDGQHHYTIDGHEKDVLVSVGWSYEGIAFRTAPIEK